MVEPLHHRKIRWGIIGLGNIAHKFATDLLTVKDAQLYAVAARSQAKADDFGTKYNAYKTYGSYNDLVRDSQVDAVYIATPHSFHKEHTLLCLEHGIAVLCEKPFAMNSVEVEQMILKAQEKKLLLMEALCTSVLPHFQFALNELRSNLYGHVLKLEADFGFKSAHSLESRVFKKSLGGGSLLDIGIYPIFAALSALGKPASITADASFNNNGVDTSCTMVFNYENEVRAFLKCSFLENTPTEAIFYCEKGIIKINSRFTGPSTVTTLFDGKEDTKDFNYTTRGYDFEIDHFNKLLRQGKNESNVMSFDFSRTLIGLLDDVRDKIGLSY